MDTQLIRDELNYKELYSFDESMQKSIDWLRHDDTLDNKLFDYNAEDEAISPCS